MQGLFSAHTGATSINRAFSSSRLALTVPYVGLNIISACGQYSDVAVCPGGQACCLCRYTECATKPGLALESTPAIPIAGANETTLNQLTRKCTSASDCSDGLLVLGNSLHLLDVVPTEVCYDGGDRCVLSLSPYNAPHDAWTSERWSSQQLRQVQKPCLECDGWIP
jgi:hypothetical protein